MVAKRTEYKWETAAYACVLISRRFQKLFLCLINEYVLASGGAAPLFLTLELDGGEWSASRLGGFSSRGNSPWYPLWAPEPVSTLWNREKSCPCQDSNPGRPVAILTELSQFKSVE
jgi:hypothetical protein